MMDIEIKEFLEDESNRISELLSHLDEHTDYLKKEYPDVYNNFERNFSELYRDLKIVKRNLEIRKSKESEGFNLWRKEYYSPNKKLIRDKHLSLYDVIGEIIKDREAS